MTTIADSPSTTHRRLPAGAAVLVLVAALLWPIPAAADHGTVSLAEVQTALDGSCGDGVAAQLGGLTHDSGGTLTVDCVAELDLNGHSLTVQNVVLGVGAELTVTDGSAGGGGVLTADATAATSTPGIGTTGATLIIESGTVIAGGSRNAAGIGGGDRGSGGTVSISGGTVTATGGSNAAGIGGGNNGAIGGTVSVSNGTVTATGGNGAAGIGGGFAGAGGSVDVGAGAVVTATGGSTAIGAGDSASSFGSLAVAGTLRLPSGNLRIASGSTVTVAAGGRILGGTAGPTVGANFVGVGGIAGSIANQGVIALAASHVTGGGVSVSGHHYRVAFDAAGGSPTPEVVTVFASSFEAGHRVFPGDPTREDGSVFGGWTDQPDGAGTTIDATSTLPGSSAGPAVQVTAYAHWVPVADVATSTITAAPTSIPANGTSTSTITVRAKDANGHNLTAGNDLVELSTTAGDLSDVHDNKDGTYTATLTSSTTAGTETITGTLNNTKIDHDATVTFTSVSTPSPTVPDAPDEEPDTPDDDPEPPVEDRGLPELTDVVAGSTHADSIDRIYRYGITVGTSNTTFNPSGDLSRGQMSTLLVRLLVLTDPDIAYPDSHAAAMQLLVERGVLLGRADGSLDSSGTLTRGQAASLLVRLIEHSTGETLATGDTSFPDAGDTHGQNIAKLTELGVVAGYGDYTYRPHTELRRDQMASLIARTIDALIEADKVDNLDA